MRTGVLGVRLSTAILIVIAVGAVGLTGGGIYHHFAATPSGELADRTPPASISTQAGKDTGSLVIHDAPQAVPNLFFVDGDGREMSLADFHGRTILLNIWATWCVPCREEMPALDRLQAKLGGPGFEVVPLSIDRDGLPKVKAFYDELGLEAIGIYLDASGKAAYRLGAVGIPTTLLINPDGLETGRLVGPAEWDSQELVGLIQQQLGKAPGEPS
ncbi:TlpA family protein disulfide reductase [Nitratireductor luteus]|uniref:TlpA family protein disulfide reductase n=1 Tax=Nitratireductor luteus TaxID=2976980 RepID=UPI00223F3100|nr:TlpA disulfide reductase family protein [Nitratireductor luteus]